MTVQVEYELGTPLDQMPAFTPFGTGSDLLKLLSTIGHLSQPPGDVPRVVSWRLQETNGNTAAFRAISEPDLAAQASRSLVRGFQLAESDAQLPKGWNVSAGQAARRVAERLGDTPTTGLRLVVSGDQPAEAQVTRKASRNLKLATSVRVTAYGSVTGTLGRVSALTERRATLWSDIDGTRVTIRFTADQFSQVRDAFMQPHVEVSGVVQENAAGQVLSVQMHELEILEAPDTTVLEAFPRGFYSELAGGMTPLDYLRMIRGDR